MKRAFRNQGACLVLFFGLAACDDSFQPFVESDYLFSIMGYLDASADTQYIRIMPLRQTVAFGSAAPLDVTATLVNLDDGSAEVLRDSIFTNIPAVFLEVADTTYHHNFWTTRKIVPGARYRLDVMRADGATAAATATIPKDYAVTMEYGTPTIIEVSDVNLGLVLMRSYTNCPPWTPWQYVWDLAQPIPPPVAGTYRVPLLPKNIAGGPGCILPLPGKWVTVASDIEWPAGLGYLGRMFPNLSRATNLTNAVGLFAGVLSKELPMGGGCVLEPRVAPCRLTYSAESATVVGRVTDASCGGVVAGGLVRLREIPSDPKAPSRLDNGVTQGYSFNVLNPGTRYTMTATHASLRTLEAPFPAVYGSREDTVSVVKGQTLVHDMTLPRLVPCGVPTTTNPI